MTEDGGAGPTHVLELCLALCLALFLALCV